MFKPILDVCLKVPTHNKGPFFILLFCHICYDNHHINTISKCLFTLYNLFWKKTSLHLFLFNNWYKVFALIKYIYFVNAISTRSVPFFVWYCTSMFSLCKMKCMYRSDVCLSVCHLMSYIEPEYYFISLRILYFILIESAKGY